MTEVKPNRRHEQAVARKRQRTRKRLLKVGIPLLAILLIGGGVLLFINKDDAKAKVDMSAVQTFPDLAREHVQTPVQYPQNPPVGGNHAPVWQNCGSYNTKIPNENAVHALEHGAVWIAYQPTLPSDQINALRSLARKSQNKYLLVSPVEGIQSPLVLSAWGKQLAVDKVDDPRFNEFISEFQQGPQTPELGASCTGGTGKPA